MKVTSKSKLGQKVVKGNELIQRAKSDLTVVELKLISYVVSLIKPTDNEFQKYEIKISDFCELTGTRSNNIYKEFKRLIDSLDDKAFWIKTNDQYLKFRWFSESTYMINKGTIQVVLNSQIKKYLFDLKKNYTSYELYNVMAFKSKYSIRLYEILKSYAYKSPIEFNIEDIKATLGASKYSAYKDFKKRVLLVAVDEINTYTDLQVTYDCIDSFGTIMTTSTGRKIASIKFHISHKQPLEKYAAYLKVLDKLEKKG